ncbi:Gas vesicle protein [Pedobacter westerhofensis]|uniref:Gas vesicle protein n=1 Tax=Pedobacter westerhofensis TaxID=425512 RepID=A0A521FTY5_9SPHI|nr:YtxH domain-containing protein [Pedobacter westerhofensis]SMO99618.1 Gas vesicle protein [Pedobacter westerhofensis]
MKNTSNVIIGLLAGLAAGGALGILLAPEKGSETRDKLSQSLQDLGDSIRDLAADQIEKLTEAKIRIVSKVQGQAENGLENLQDDIEHA